MNLQHLRTFTQAVRSGNLSEAARVLHVTQPAVTQQIKALESHFNAQLLERTNRGVEPTQTGQVVFAYANRMMDLVEALEQEVMALRASTGGELVVGASSTVGGYAVPCSICIFKERFPEAKFRLRVGNRQNVLGWLRQGQVQVALIEGESFRGPFVRRTIASDELALIAPASNGPWSERPVITTEELVKAPFIMREAGSGTREVIERALAPAGISVNDLNVILELDHVDSIKAAVETGRGVSVVSTMAIRKELRTGTLRTVEVEGVEFKQRIFLAWHRDKVQTRLEKLFVSFLRSPHRGFC
ncbi:MAG: LysR family transcriptional regulator [Bacillota bacterium]